MRTKMTAIALAVLVSTSVTARGSEEPVAKTPGPVPKVQWFGTWKTAKAEAQRTGRPILLTSAAPQCKGTPGIW